MLQSNEIFQKIDVLFAMSVPAKVGAAKATMIKIHRICDCLYGVSAISTGRLSDRAEFMQAFITICVFNAMSGHTC